jgi:hypothetical protein
MKLTLYFFLITSIAQAQEWTRVSIDKKVSLLFPAQATTSTKGHKTVYSCTYSSGDITVEHSTVPDSIVAVYGTSDNFDFYYRGFVEGLKDATGWKIEDEKEKAIGDTRIRSFKTPTSQGDRYWSLFMIDRESYLVSYMAKEKTNDADRLIGSIEVK